MRKNWLIVLAGLLLIVSLGGLWYSKKTTPTGATARDATVTVLSTQVKTGSLVETVALSGKLDAQNSANVVAKSSGKVGGIMVDVGTPVSEGQTMIVLESDDLAATVAASQAGVESAQITYDLAGKQFERGQALFTSGALSQADFDNNYKGALDKARAALKSAQATLAQNQVRYNDTFIKSPLTGVVTARNINVGELAGGSTALVTVMNLDKLVVTVNVNENEVNRIKVGQEVAVKVSAVSETPLRGIISNIAMAANTSTKVFPIKVQIENKNHVLKPGMFAEASFTWVGNPGLLVPNTAVVPDNTNKKVYIITDGIAKSVNVVTGESDAQNTLILSGIKEGDQIVMNVPGALKDGTKVKPSETVKK
jgi:cobalt-zinc-cadmium efflux system membrane fusion protein